LLEVQGRISKRERLGYVVQAVEQSIGYLLAHFIARGSFVCRLLRTRPQDDGLGEGVPRGIHMMAARSCNRGTQPLPLFIVPLRRGATCASAPYINSRHPELPNAVRKCEGSPLLAARSNIEVTLVARSSRAHLKTRASWVRGARVVPTRRYLLLHFIARGSFVCRLLRTRPQDDGLGEGVPRGIHLMAARSCNRGTRPLPLFIVPL